MKVKLLCFGSVKNKHLKALIDEYERRIKHHSARLEILSWQDRSTTQQQERIKGYVSAHPQEAFILLDEQGTTYSTQGFYDMLEARWKEDMTITFILGDAHGFDEAFKQEFTRHVALSTMALPHEMARLVWTEQLYRIVCMKKGIPYHK